MDGDWQVVGSRRPVLVAVYKENATGIHYVLFKCEILGMRGRDDCIWARAVVQTSPNHFVFSDDEYSSEGALCVKDFAQKYTFVRNLPLSKIATKSFEGNDARLVSCVYSVHMTV